MQRNTSRTIESLADEGMTRRQLLRGAGALLAYSAAASTAAAAQHAAGESAAPKPDRNNDVEYGQETLRVGIRSRRIDNNNGVTIHALEAGFAPPAKPCVVLLHGFPELGYTWRNQLLPLASAGFHVIAPDARGYGRSTSEPVTFEDSLLPYSMLNRVGDVLGLVRALGYEQVAAVVGHDWGGPTAQWCARLRPDVFLSVVSVSTPLLGDSACRSARLTPTAAKLRVSTSKRIWLTCHGPGNITRRITRHRVRTRTCGARPRACTTSCASTTTTRARTGRRTSLTGDNWICRSCCLTKDCYRVASCRMLPADHNPNYISTTTQSAICRVSGRSSKVFLCSSRNSSP